MTVILVSDDYHIRIKSELKLRSVPFYMFKPSGGSSFVDPFSVVIYVSCLSLSGLSCLFLAAL